MLFINILKLAFIFIFSVSFSFNISSFLCALDIFPPNIYI